jgi:surface antigen
MSEGVPCDMPAKAGAVPGPWHGAEANGTGWTGLHASHMAPRKAGMAASKATTMAPAESTTMAPATTAAMAATTSGEDFAWSQNQERARERDA